MLWDVTFTLKQTPVAWNHSDLRPAHLLLELKHDRIDGMETPLWPIVATRLVGTTSRLGLGGHFVGTKLLISWY